MVLIIVFISYKSNIIICSHWKSYGSMFLTYYNDVTKPGAIVILLTHAMLSSLYQSYFFTINLLVRYLFSFIFKFEF